MTAIRIGLLAFATLLVAMTAQAQITHYSDSADFDNDFARLREIDFEDVYSVTLQHITIRTPWGLNCFGYEDSTQSDGMNSFLWLGQGATLDFPTRTRTVELEGYSNRFRLIVTDFNDAVDTTELGEYPVKVTRSTGIRRIEFWGTDEANQGQWDINWQGGLLALRTLDEDGDTLASTDFEELEPDHYYLTGKAQDARSTEPDSSFFGPIEWHGITVTEPTFGFVGVPLSEPEGRADPDNPIMNLEIELAPGATVDFAEGTEGVLVTFEAVHHLDTFWVAVTDYAGRTDTVEAMGWGHPIDTNWVEDQQYTFVHLGFGSPDGIKRVEFLGATGPFSYGTVALATVHVAETPVTEMAAIKSSVDELDASGFLNQGQSAELGANLVAAMASAQGGDRTGAIQLLNTFRSDVQTFASQKVLVSEEAAYFLNDAAYVISRLNGPAGVDAPQIIRTSGVALGLPSLSTDGIRLSFDAPAGSQPVITIHDMRGALLRTLPLEGTSGDMLWNLRDGSGAPVSAGGYLVTLIAEGARTTRLVRVVR